MGIEKRESINFILWGLGLLGLGLLVIVAVDIIRFVFLSGTILWLREIVVLITGLLCLALSYKGLRKNS